MVVLMVHAQLMAQQTRADAHLKLLPLAVLAFRSNVFVDYTLNRDLLHDNLIFQNEITPRVRKNAKKH
jgi:hypothetical protein